MTSALLTGLALARGPLRGDVSWREAPDWFEQALAAGAVALDVNGSEVDANGAALQWRAAVPEDRDAAVLLSQSAPPRLAVLRNPRRPVNLRMVGAELSDDDAAWATTAVALAQWHRRSGHCPACGGATAITKAGWSRTCIAAGHESFPRNDPAVIVLVRDHDDRALLGRRGDWPSAWFSTLAGFVEAGESAEHALCREILEEAGVEIDPQRLHYRGSQPWPFPSSLMLGYHAWTLTARADSVPDGEEIVETRWFTRSELAEAAHDGHVLLPPPVSIARLLIDDWYGQALPGHWLRP